MELLVVSRWLPKWFGKNVELQVYVHVARIKNVATSTRRIYAQEGESCGGRKSLGREIIIYKILKSSLMKLIVIAYC